MSEVYRLCKAGCGQPVSTPRGRYCPGCRAARDAASKRRHKAKRASIELPLDDTRECCQFWLDARSALFGKHGRKAALKRWPDLVHKQCAQCRQWKAANTKPVPVRLLLPGEDFFERGFLIEKGGSTGTLAA